MENRDIDTDDTLAESSRNKAYRSHKVYGQKLTGRSRITNGSTLLPDVDRRSSWARRYRDLAHGYENDLGGAGVLSEGQRALCRRAALLQTELEFADSRFAKLSEEDKVPGRERLDDYARLVGALRRVIESLGLHQGRKARDITPRDDYTNAVIDGLVNGYEGSAR